jgi:hypothetical protein
MKKIYTTLLSMTLLVGGITAQNKTQVPLSQKVKPMLDGQAAPMLQQRGGGGAIWTDDFSDPSTWVLGVAPGAPNLNWQIGIGLENTGDFPTPSVQSTTAANGYAMLDSDGFGNQNLVESSHMTTASPIDLSGIDNVVIEFESFYRKWTYEECYLVISTNNTDWPALDPDTDISGLPNVFYVWPGMAVQEVISNPTLVRINITEAAGNQPQVWVRFHWTGTYGYSWFVDDVAVREQPAHDMVLDYGFLSHTGEGEEYGRIPGNQLGSQMLVGGSFLNFGYEDQTNIQMVMEVRNSSDVVVFNANFNVPALASGQSTEVEQSVTLPNLPNDLYTATFTVTSADEQDGPNFGNNIYLRTFEVTDLRYSLDGLGNHPPGYQTLGSLGTNSFVDGAAADGFMMLVYYEVIAPLTVYGIEFAITSTSVPDAGLVVNLHDAGDILGTPTEVGLPLASNDVIHSLTQAEVDAGVVVLLFTGPITLQPGEYYAGVEMYSNGNQNDVRILNDLSVPQPSLASLIYLPNDDVYTNGNAAAIRLITDPTISIEELDDLAGISVFPNPSNGILNIRSEAFDVYAVEVIDALGHLVHVTRINGNGVLDLSDLSQGVYAVRISNGAASTVKRVVLH